jgi:hypothetical protein
VINLLSLPSEKENTDIFQDPQPLPSCISRCTHPIRSPGGSLLYASSGKSDWLGGLPWQAWDGTEKEPDTARTVVQNSAGNKSMEKFISRDLRL